MSEYRLRGVAWGKYKIQKKGWLFWTTVMYCYCSFDVAVQRLNAYQKGSLS